MANRIVVRGRQAPFRSSGQRRATEWQQIVPVTSTQATVGGVLLNSASAALLAQRPFTIVRIIITGHILSDQSAGGEVQIGALGLAVVSEQALAAGIGSLPTPVIDA